MCEFSGLKTGNDKFLSLNESYFKNGYFLHVPSNLEVGKPLNIEIETSKNSILHNIIIIEPNSKIDIIEEYSNSSSGQYLNSCVTRVYAMDDSRLNFFHLNNWTNDFCNFTNVIGALGANSNVNWVSACFGGKLNRLKLDTIFNGQGGQCNNLGLFLGKGNEHIDFTTNMYHNTLNTTNNVLVDGILKDQATAVYRGLIKIEKEAQKTNSYLANHNLMLGSRALANSIPSLKIDANDVKASHGSTTGKINEEHLFYLMARGLSRNEAEALIVEGFFEPIIQKIPLEEIREKIRNLIKNE